jgi:hypothetical protein
MSAVTLGENGGEEAEDFCQELEHRIKPFNRFSAAYQIVAAILPRLS